MTGATVTHASNPASNRVDWYRQMLRIRLFEDKVQKLFLQNMVHGTTHLCQGQEAISVGVCAALEADDYVTMTYRGHGQALARGMGMTGIFAELFGRRSGVSRGLGGSMHLTDPALGLIGCFAIVGAGLPVALGAAMSSAMKGDRRVAVTFFGDGATNIGTFHETLNMASVWRAPIVFVCENNLYGEYSPIRRTTPINDLAERAAPFRMPGNIVDGNDVEAVFAAATSAVDRARAGGGPTLLECKTYRHQGHSRSDPGKYRPQAEVQEWLGRDPLKVVGDRLAETGALSAEDQQALRVELQREIDVSAAEAAEGDFPTLEEAANCVYAD